MKYYLLGRSGLRVSELCLGTMTFGECWGWGASKDVSEKIFNLFVDRGGNFIDTSVNYTDGESEEIVGSLIKGRRDEFVLATKYSLNKTDTINPNLNGNSRKNMMRSIEQSLKRLKTDYIDIFYIHMWDSLTPLDEIMRAFDDLVRQGKVLYVAASDTPSWILAEANTKAELLQWPRFIAVQAPYSLLKRDLDRSIFPTAKRHEIAVLPWAILGNGILTGKFMKKIEEPTRLDPEKIILNKKHKDIILKVKEISDETDHPMSQVSINWLRQQQNRGQIIPVIGARTFEQAKENFGSLDWELDQDHFEELDSISEIDMGFPHNFLPNNPYLYGETFEKIMGRRN